MNEGELAGNKDEDVLENGIETDEKSEGADELLKRLGEELDAGINPVALKVEVGVEVFGANKFVEV